jgi:hypothetical protein
VALGEVRVMTAALVGGKSLEGGSDVVSREIKKGGGGSRRVVIKRCDVVKRCAIEVR